MDTKDSSTTTGTMATSGGLQGSDASERKLLDYFFSEVRDIIKFENQKSKLMKKISTVSGNGGEKGTTARAKRNNGIQKVENIYKPPSIEGCLINGVQSQAKTVSTYAHPKNFLSFSS